MVAEGVGGADLRRQGAEAVDRCPAGLEVYGPRQGLAVYVPAETSVQP